jgi:MFS family permease
VKRRGHLLSALADRGFRRLLAVRLASQFGDGVFQASLAGAVLFNPERQAHANDIAAGFTVLLLPYSLVGPFAGVLLDRWWRQRVLVVANTARGVAVLGVAAEIATGVAGVAFYMSALVIISISRFILSAFSAGQPHVVEDTNLVTANALAATAGTIITAAGGGAAIGVRGLLGETNGDYALIAAAALVPFLLSAALARRFPLSELGPTDAERGARETLGEVLRGLAAGARHVRDLPPVANGLASIGLQRLCLGVWTVCAVLLYRNYFTDHGVFRAGLAGLGQLVAGVAAGGALAALITPSAFRTIGAVKWPAAMLGASAVVEVALGLPYVPGLMVLTALLLGFTSQAVKITVDTLIQHHVVDAFRGRVFALYDMLFNVALVAAAVLTAAALPEDGHSPVAVVLIGVGLAVAALGYLYLTARAPAAVTSSARRTSS